MNNVWSPWVNGPKLRKTDYTHGFGPDGEKAEPGQMFGNPHTIPRILSLLGSPRSAKPRSHSWAPAWDSRDNTRAPQGRKTALQVHQGTRILDTTPKYTLPDMVRTMLYMQLLRSKVDLRLYVVVDHHRRPSRQLSALEIVTPASNFAQVSFLHSSCHRCYDRQAC